MKKITELTAELAAPAIAEQGCTLWDVEYVKEAGTWYLRILLDKEGGVEINDCEAVSRAVDPILYEKVPIPDSYHFEVSSAGLERTLRLPQHFTKCLGQKVTVRLYRPKDGAKEFVGVLRQYEDGRVTIETAAGPMTFEKNEVALVRLYVEF